jgi:DNA-binding NarL/FixJ family response regulator
VRIAIAEDSIFVREGLTRILREAGLDVVAAFDNADALLLEVGRTPLDLVILDIRLPPTHTDEGIRAAIQIKEHQPDLAVLVLSQYVEIGLAIQLLARSAEGVGYLLKDRIGNVEEFLNAVRRLANGGSAIDPQIVSALMQRRRSDHPLMLLTPREREVLELMAAGTSNQGIAAKLVITTRAVEKYVSSIFDKLGIPSTRNDSRRVMAVLLYLRS